MCEQAIQLPIKNGLLAAVPFLQGRTDFPEKPLTWLSQEQPGKK